MDELRREMRAADSDRQAAAERLRVSLDEGRLDLHEYDTRLSKAYQSVTYGDLADLFVDLPGPAPTPPVQLQAFVPPGPLANVPIAPMYPNAAVHARIPPRRTSNFAVAGLVLGILALEGFWIPFGDVLLGGTAIVLSCYGIKRTGRSGYAGREMAIGGLVCGILGFVLAIFITGVVLIALRR